MAGQDGDRLTLAGLLASGEAVPLQRAMALVRAAALAVDALHARGTTHGAIEPAAFALDGEDRLTLRSPGSDPVTSPLADSSLDYWSPQRRAGEPIRPADDLYALGLIATRLLADGHPGGLTREIEAVLRAQTAWSPSARFASGAELVRELDRAIERMRAASDRSDPSDRPGRDHRTAVLGPPAALGLAGSRPAVEPSWAAARRVARAREARRLALAELPDRRGTQIRRQAPSARPAVSRRDYPDLPLAGGWVAVIIVVLCSVYLLPIYFMLFSHG